MAHKPSYEDLEQRVRELELEWSQRAPADEELLRRRKYLESVLHHAPDAIITLDASHRVMEWNAGAEKIFGYSREQAEGRNLDDLVSSPEVEPEARSYTRRVLSGETIGPFETVRCRRDGTPVEVIASASPIMIDGSLQGVVAVYTDITERKHAERRLRASEEKQRAILEASPNPVVVYNNQGHPEYINPAFTELFGWRLEELAGAPIPYVPEDQRRVTEEKIDEIFNQGVVGRLETKRFTKDGRLVEVMVCAALIRGADGVPSGVVVNMTDLSRQKELEAQVRQIHKMEALSRMAGAVAHNFNNQLSVVLGNLELALSQSTSGPEEREGIIRAMQAAHKASEVSQLMLTYLGQSVAQGEPLDLASCCRETLDELEQAKPRDISLERRIPESGPVACLSGEKMHQILSHLVTNAWEAIGERSGRVSVSLATYRSAEMPEGRLLPPDWKPTEARYACLEVSDTGNGMGSEDIDRIFDPFYSDKFPGRGLGLAVVQGVAKAYGGAIGVSSQPGRGSAFRIYLPVSDEEQAAERLQPEREPEESADGTILIVDDQEAVRNVSQAMLEHLGYRVLTARGGAEAVELYREHEVDISCVITDLSMPGQDGWETLRALRRIRPGLPVILASGYDEAQAMSGDHQEVPQAFLHKPYQLAELQEALRKVL